MPLPGGAADKLGNRYEAGWTVRCLLEVLRGRWEAMRLEPPGPEGDGVEFWLEKNGQRAYYQVKRQNTSSKRWTLAALNRAGILDTIRQKLEGRSASFVFASIADAHELRNLAERARSAQSWEEFESRFLESKEHKKSFATLSDCWEGVEEAEVYDLLRRIEVKSSSEGFLRKHLDALAIVACEGNAKAICDSLAEIALQRVHRITRVGDLWEALKERGHVPREWSENAEVLESIDETNQRYDRSLARYAAGGHEISRDESEAACEVLRGAGGCEPRNILISGEAGVGKSFVMLQLARKVDREGLPRLAFRLDRLEPVENPQKLGERLGLPASPAYVLANIAGEQPCVLVVDQLDAVSLTSGRSPRFFHCIEALLDEARSFPNMRVVLACRAFDLENDHRFRQLTGSNGRAEQVEVKQLPKETVRGAVARYDLNPDELNERQVRLLAVPLHLQLLAEIADEVEAGTPRYDFWTAKDLFDRYWSRKRHGLRERLNRDVGWLPLFDAMTDYMSEKQVLSVPHYALDEYEGLAERLVSEHVLAEESGRLSFFHESFFDYVFARRFAGRSLSLEELLLESEQALFRRAQVRQILLHEREGNWPQYLADLRSILHHEKVRFHLKEVVFALLRQVSDPSRSEWEIVASLLEKGEPYGSSVRFLLGRSPNWFALLYDEGLFESWLFGDERPQGIDRAFSADMALNVVGEKPERATKVVSRLASRACREAGGGWRSLFDNEHCTRNFRGRELFDVYVSLMRCGIWVPNRGDLFPESMLHWMQEVRSEHPDWFCEAVEAALGGYFRRLAQHFDEEENGSIFGVLRGNASEEKLLLELAEEAPAAFVTGVLPFVLATVEAFAIRGGPSPYPDRVWMPFHKGARPGVPEAIVKAVVKAIHRLSREDPPLFEACIQRIETKAERYGTPQFVLVRLFTDEGENMAERGLRWLIDDSSRFKTGYSGSAYWGARELLEAATPYASEKTLRDVERAILSYQPAWEHKALTDSEWSGLLDVETATRWGHAQYVLLGGITSERLSPLARERLQEWRRKFDPPDPPKGFGQVHAVGAPRSISKGEPGRMSDGDWLRAIETYDSEDRRTDYSDDGAYGGGRQLAHVLQTEAEQNPTRFVRLAERFSRDALTCYFDAVLRGVAESAASADEVVQLVECCHALPSRACGRWIAHLVGKKADVLPAGHERVAEIIGWYAQHDPDPEQERWRIPTESGQVLYAGDPHRHGINCVRGSAAETMGRLLFESADWFPVLQPAIEQAVDDSSTAVRSCVVLSPLALLNSDASLAVELFDRLCRDSHDALLGTTWVERFLYHAGERHWKKLAPILRRAVRSERKEVRRVGARQATLTNLADGKAERLVQKCREGDAALRCGMAEIYAPNLRQARIKEKCEGALMALLDDDEEEVREAAATCFDGFEGNQLGQYVALVEAFARSHAFEEHPRKLLHALSETTASLPEATCVAVGQFVELLDTDTDRAKVLARSIGEAARLIVKAYAQAESSDAGASLRSRCLDLIDQLVARRAHGIGRALSTFER